MACDISFTFFSPFFLSLELVAGREGDWEIEGGRRYREAGIEQSQEFREQESAQGNHVRGTEERTINMYNIR